jgi:hypothetical protein
MAGTSVFFSIPLAAKRDEAGWRVACTLLRNTLRSILQQSDPVLQVVITGHDRPALPELDDPRVTFLAAPFDPPRHQDEFRPDKHRKRGHSARHIRALGGGYIVLMDADDLVSRHLVLYIRGKAHPNGYIFKHGYSMDWESGAIAPLPGSMGIDFDRYCGSCAAIHFTPDEIAAREEDHLSTYHGQFRNHAKVEQAVARRGRPLQPIPFPAAAYLVNTSQNLSLSRGVAHMEWRLGRISEGQVPLTRELVDEFSLAPVLASSCLLRSARPAAASST